MSSPFPAALQTIVDALAAYNAALLTINTDFPGLPTSPPLTIDPTWNIDYSNLHTAFFDLYNSILYDPTNYPNTYYSLLLTEGYIDEFQGNTLTTNQATALSTYTTYLSRAYEAPADHFEGDPNNNYQNYIEFSAAFILAYITGSSAPPGFADEGVWDTYVQFPLPLEAACFNEGTLILCLVNSVEQYVPIENIKPHAIVKTIRDGYVMVTHVGKRRVLNNPKHPRHCMYVMSKQENLGLTHDLIVTGGHSILVDQITEEERNLLESLDCVNTLDKKYLLLAAAAPTRFKKVEDVKEFTCYHLVLKDSDENKRYGIYANGVLTESISKRVYDLVGFEDLRI